MQNHSLRILNKNELKILKEIKTASNGRWAITILGNPEMLVKI
jgi:hypothetical protein